MTLNERRKEAKFSKIELLLQENVKSHAHAAHSISQRQLLANTFAASGGQFDYTIMGFDCQHDCVFRTIVYFRDLHARFLRQNFSIFTFGFESTLL